MSHQCTYLPAAEQCHGISPLQKKTVRRACWAILCRLWEASDLNGIEKGVLLLCGFISSIKLRSVFKFGFLSHPSPLERARPLSEMCQAAGAGLSPCSFQAEGLSFCFSCYCLDGGALVIVSDVSESVSQTHLTARGCYRVYDDLKDSLSVNHIDLFPIQIELLFKT